MLAGNFMDIGGLCLQLLLPIPLYITFSNGLHVWRITSDMRMCVQGMDLMRPMGSGVAWQDYILKEPMGRDSLRARRRMRLGLGTPVTCVRGKFHSFHF